MKIKAAVLREYNQPVSIEEINLAPPKEREVLVKTAYTGFCHSDYSFIVGATKFPIPLVLGHEASGVVVDVGPGVTSVKKGDHVVARPGCVRVGTVLNVQAARAISAGRAMKCKEQVLS